MMARVQYMMGYTKIDIVEDTKPDNIRTKWSTSFESRSPEGSTNQDVSIQNFMNMNGRTIFFINFAMLFLDSLFITPTGRIRKELRACVFLIRTDVFKSVQIT